MGSFGTESFREQRDVGGFEIGGEWVRLVGGGWRCAGAA